MIWGERKGYGPAFTNIREFVCNGQIIDRNSEMKKNNEHRRKTGSSSATL